MSDESHGSGFCPPSWWGGGVTPWEIGWAREAKRGMREALKERKKKPVKATFREDREENPESED
jgi:hypothetical protein